MSDTPWKKRTRLVGNPDIVDVNDKTILPDVPLWVADRIVAAINAESDLRDVAAGYLGSRNLWKSEADRLQVLLSAAEENAVKNLMRAVSAGDELAHITHRLTGSEIYRSLETTAGTSVLRQTLVELLELRPQVAQLVEMADCGECHAHWPYRCDKHKASYVLVTMPQAVLMDEETK